MLSGSLNLRYQYFTASYAFALCSFRTHQNFLNIFPNTSDFKWQEFGHNLFFFIAHFFTFVFFPKQFYKRLFAICFFYGDIFRKLPNCVFNSRDSEFEFWVEFLFEQKRCNHLHFIMKKGNVSGWSKRLQVSDVFSGAGILASWNTWIVERVQIMVGSGTSSNGYQMPDWGRESERQVYGCRNPVFTAFCEGSERGWSRRVGGLKGELTRFEKNF